METDGVLHQSCLQEACLLQVLVEGNPKSVVTALSHGLRHYTSRVNSENVLEEVGGQGGLKSFDRIPVPGSCEDFHSECQKWALAVSADII